MISRPEISRQYGKGWDLQKIWINSLLNNAIWRIQCHSSLCPRFPSELIWTVRKFLSSTGNKTFSHIISSCVRVISLFHSSGTVIYKMRTCVRQCIQNYRLWQVCAVLQCQTLTCQQDFGLAADQHAIAILGGTVVLANIPVTALSAFLEALDEKGAICQHPNSRARG